MWEKNSQESVADTNYGVNSGMGKLPDLTQPKKSPEDRIYPRLIK